MPGAIPADVSAAVLNVVVAVLLIQRFGALGAAIATTSTFILQNVVYQWGLRTQTWVAAVDRRYLRPYASIVIGALLVAAVGLTVDPPLIVGIVFAGLVALAVFGLNRRSLQIVDIYPELGRFRLMRRLFGDPSTP